jgi:hypothetical protein
VLYNVGNFFNKWETVRFTRRTAPWNSFDGYLVNVVSVRTNKKSHIAEKVKFLL